MPRNLPALPSTPEQFKKLTSMARGHKVEARLKERACIVLKGIAGVCIKDTAQELGFNKDTVSLWRRRFLAEGVEGLQDRPRTGAPRKYGTELRNRLLAQRERAPPNGFGHWDGALLASALGSRVARRRSGCVSRDPDFARKAADVVGLYLAPPENALVFRVDETPSIQALTRPTG